MIADPAVVSLIPDQAVLDDLRHAGGKLFCWQRVQRSGIHIHHTGHVKRSDHVFILLKIDTGLAADTAVHLSQERCRNLEKIDAPQVGGCDESGQIAHNTAAQGDEQVAAIKMVLDQ